MSKIIVINSTMRKKGNSQRLAESFVKGAKDAGHDVTLLNLHDINLKFCVGCLACQSNSAHKCVLNDDMNTIYDSIQNADILVFATPIYFYQISGQLKTFLDRLNPLYPRKNKFKAVYLLATCADSNTSAFDGAKTAIQGWIDCYDGVEFVDTLGATSVTDVGDIESSEVLQKAYSLAKNL